MALAVLRLKGYRSLCCERRIHAQNPILQTSCKTLALSRRAAHLLHPSCQPTPHHQKPARSSGLHVRRSARLGGTPSCLSDAYHPTSSAQASELSTSCLSFVECDASLASNLVRMRPRTPPPPPLGRRTLIAVLLLPLLQGRPVL